MPGNMDADTHLISTVRSPVLGMMGHIPGPSLNPRACKNALNITYRNHVVKQRYGYVTKGATTNKVPLSFFSIINYAGTETLYMLTTRGVFSWTGSAWTSVYDSENYGTVDNRLTWAFIQNKLLIGSPDTAPYNVTDSGAVSAWSSYAPYVLIPYKYRLLGFGDGSNDEPIRVRYSVAYDYNDTTGTNSGFFDWTEGEGGIVGAKLLGNFIAVYKQHSCGLLDYVGGSSIFSMDVQVPSKGLAAKDAIVDLGTKHMFLSHDNIYMWDGGRELDPVGDPIKDEMLDELNTDKIERSFAIYSKRYDEVMFFVPINSENYPTRFWTYNLKSKGWSKNTITAVSGAGVALYGGTEYVLLGGTDGQVYHYNYSALDDNGDAISSEFETGDFVISEEEYAFIKKRYFQIRFDMKASAATTVSVADSYDEGSSFQTAKSISATAAYTEHKAFLNRANKKMRFKISHSTSGKQWEMRAFGIEHTVRERK